MKFVKAIRRRLRRQRVIMVRRWYLTVAVLSIMLPLLFMAYHAGGVYYSTANLLFLPPSAAVGGNSLSADPGRTVYFAAVVERRFNAQANGVALHTTDAPLYGTGVRHGYTVYLPNAGGQWQTNFNRPLITVEIVGSSSEEVTQQFDTIINRLDALALQPQVQMGIQPQSYITTELAPAIPNVSYIGVRNKKAVMALGALTLGLLTGVTQLGDRFMRTVRRRKTARARIHGRISAGQPKRQSVGLGSLAPVGTSIPRTSESPRTHSTPMA